MDRAAPVAIGGVGGSGTRLVAQLLRAAGISIGDDFNESSDTLWFTLLFKRREILECGEAEFDLLTDALVAALAGGCPLAPATEARVRELAREDRAQYPASWLQERCESLLAASRRPAHGRPWGWKEPNTHVVIERLWQRIPGLRYVHVVRHGVDMAFSSNQNQLALWGPMVLGDEGDATPRRSLAYWCRVHRRMQALFADNPGRMYWLDYDALRRSPRVELDGLCEFMGIDASRMHGSLGAIRSQPHRFILEPAHGFYQEDLDFVRSLGYALP